MGERGCGGCGSVVGICRRAPSVSRLESVCASVLGPAVGAGEGIR